MTEDEKIIRHLEMIQGIINRLGRNSFLVKLGSIAVVITGKLISVFLIYIYYLIKIRMYQVTYLLYLCWTGLYYWLSSWDFGFWMDSIYGANDCFDITMIL